MSEERKREPGPNGEEAGGQDWMAQATQWLNSLDTGLDAHLGLRYVAAEQGRVVAELRVDERHLQPHGLVHGGVYAAMIESVCSTGANLAVWDQGRTAVGLENSTSFLRAVRGGTLTCEAAPLAQGRTSHVWEARVLDSEGRLVASGRVRLLVLERGRGAAGADLHLHLKPEDRHRGEG